MSKIREEDSKSKCPDASGSEETKQQIDTEPEEAEVSPRTLHGWKWAISYIAMLSTSFLFSIDNTVVANIQPAIIASLGSVELLPWIGTGFALGTMAILSWGKALGVFSIRPMYLWNILIFEACSALCGAAPNMPAFIIGRVISGVAGSGMYSGTLTYISLSTTLKERPAYMAGTHAMWGIGTVLGPVVGGAFAESSATWRWGFYINIVIAGVFAPAYIFLLPSIDPQPDRTFIEKCKMMDWPMTIVFLAGSTCLTMAITFGGGVYPWDSWEQITLWVMTGVLLIVAILLMKFHPGVDKQDRLYPAHFLRKPVLMNLQLQTFLASGIVLSLTYFFPLFFQFARGDAPLDAGVRLLPVIIFMVVFSIVNAVMLPKFSLISVWYIAGSGLTLLGCALLYTIKETTPISHFYGFSILIGTGTGCYIVVGFTVIQSLVPASEIANAVGAMTIAQDLGMVLFLSISGSIFQNTAVSKIQSVLPHLSAEEAGQLVVGATGDAFTRLSAADREAIIPQITAALSNIWLFYAVAAGLSFLCSFLLGITVGNMSLEWLKRNSQPRS